MNSIATKWAKGAKLILQDTEVKVLQDRKDSWPAELEITGFTYYRLGGLPSGESQPIATREVEWLKKWLEKQQLYSCQPHEQLAKVLKEEGYPSKARDVLYLSKDREKTATTGPNRYWLIFLKWTIGYGYKLHYIFYWLFGMTTFGTFLLVCFKQGPGKDIIQKEFRNLVKGVVDNYFYSLDMLMPILKLDEWSTVQLSGLTKYYFYIHKVIGYLLSFVIIAWLTGIVYR